MNETFNEKKHISELNPEISNENGNNENNGTAHTGSCLNLLGNAKERTQSKELAKHYVIYDCRCNQYQK